MATIYLGIDVSKGYADFALLDEDRELLEPIFQLDDTPGGHARLTTRLEELFRSGTATQVSAAVESTGGYENNWVAMLRRRGEHQEVRVARLNAAHVRSSALASGRRVTTDAVSAEDIGRFLIAHPEKVVFEDQDRYAGLRRQWGLIQQLLRQRLGLVNQLESLLYDAHPELIPYVSRGMSACHLQLVRRYPSASRLARARVQTLARIPFITEERARTLIEAARQSVASADDEVTCEVVQETARQILHLDQVIERQKKRLCTQPGLPKEVALLTTFKGLGTYTAIGLLIHIQNVDRFASAKKLSSFFGLHPSFRQSGDGHTGSRMSKKGAPSVRAMLFMVTFSAIQSNPVIAPLYQRRIEQGMSRMAAIGVCMHKTLRILYGMLKTGTAFDPMVEQHHRERTAIKPRTPGQSDKRRYLVYDRSAPVSRRADRRRRQQKSSQGAGGTTNGMSSSTAARSSVTTGAKTATPKTIQKR